MTSSRSGVYDFFRLALACLIFTTVEPGIGDLLDWAEPWVGGLVALLIGTGISFLLFEGLSPYSEIKVDWTDALGSVPASGPMLDVHVNSEGQGRIYLVEARYGANALIGRWVLGLLCARGLKLEVHSEQREISLAPETRPTGNETMGIVYFPFSTVSQHHLLLDENVAVDASLMNRQSLDSPLKYQLTTNDRTSTWVARRLVLLKPAIRSIRGIRASD